MRLLSVSTVAALATTVLSHGLITKPNSRAPGAASLAACGASVVNNIKGDNTSHVEGLPEAAAKDKAYHADQCNLWLCKGLQFGDNKDNVQQWTTGQKVPIDVYIRIPHKGTANISIVDTKTDTYVEGGSNLLYWGDYADEKVKPNYPANQTSFSVTVPDLGGKCRVAGDCVLQWWWYGTGARQTYESCVDFAIVDAVAAAPKLARSRFWNF
ncbi:Uncharacterized protein BP5553_00752 [Venustampulla echinocandica]|uniref:Chitin-binding type-4 domain-containing protein n=1 Tax=Venustampulla echinocandica TaxID=2656787 RepID=A0A370TZ17_9HELO|nr:Uncharacterized protein BP5553_00752 [Venustampulla echinocandica]RDL40773.1 Uncharacterized protein BP5553_00752 [Venustampulla echinocandica]